MLTTLNIIIGLIFVLLLFSLLTSTVMEVIASILSLRARNLRYTLENMLGEKMDDFVRHPLFRQLSYATNRRSRISSYFLPSWVSKDTFTAILADFLGAGGEELEKKIEALDEGDLKRMMQFLFRQSGGDPVRFKKEAGMWFDEIMTRASEWYKRNLKWWLFGVGFVLALIFNVDTIQVYQNISASSTVQKYLVDLATNYTEKVDSVAGPNLNLTLDQSIVRLDSALQQIEYISSPLGLGWQSIEEKRGVPWWLIKLAGLLLTAISVTFGAPFWFDLLRRLLSLRGGVSAEKTTEPQPAPAPPTAEESPVVKPVAPTGAGKQVPKQPSSPTSGGTKPVG